MFSSNRFSSFMISDILGCDKQNQDVFPKDTNGSPMDYNSLKSYIYQSNEYSMYSQSNICYNWSNPSIEEPVSCKSLGETTGSPVCPPVGPTVDTIVLQHYLLRQRMLMQAKPRKGGQIRFTSQQSVALEKQFSRQKYLSPPERKSIATELGLTERQIKTWFQNRRAKWRRYKQTNEDLEEDKHNLYNKYKTTDSCSGDNDNEDHFDGYHTQNSTLQSHRNHINVDFALINLT